MSFQTRSQAYQDVAPNPTQDASSLTNICSTTHRRVGLLRPLSVELHLKSLDADFCERIGACSRDNP